ncbi:MAG: M28 family peptidase [Kangiellaceae bacterium]|nr:M28 family peptidase [Kangiellaceae bacterium]
MTSVKFSVKPLLFSLLMLVVIASLFRSQIQPIAPKDKTTPAIEFSAARAFDQLEYLTSEQVPHSVDTQANRLVEQRLIEVLRAMDYQEEIQDEHYCEASDYGRLKCTRIRNIIVKKEGTDKGKNAILLSAHYDSVPAGPGGSDAGAAVGTLLETARLLKQLGTTKNDVIFLFNEGEEFGLIGAKVFMERHPSAKTLKLAINVEARGTTGQSVMFETGEDSGWLVERYFDSTPSPLSSSLFYEVYKFLPNDTDLTIFKDHGLQGLNFAHAELEPHYHTPLDNLENLNLGSLQHHGDNVWGVLKSIVNEDLSTTSNGNLVYTDILGFFKVHWQEPSSINIALTLLLVLCGLITTFLSREKLSIGKVLIATLVMLSTVAIAVLIAWLVQFATQSLSTTTTPWRANQLPMMLTLWLFVISICLLFVKSVFKSFESLEILVGQLLFFVLLSIVSSLYMAGISFLFVIPSFVGCLLLLISLFIHPMIQSRNWMAYIACGQSVIVIIVFLPIIKVLEIMVSYPMSMAMGLFLGFVVVGLSPLVTFYPENYRTFNRLFAGGSVVATLFLIMTIQQPAFTESMPQGLNILYVQNGQKAEVLTGSSRQYPPQELIEAFDSSELNESLPWGKWQMHTGQIEHQSIKPLTFAIVGSNTTQSNETHSNIASNEQVVALKIEDTAEDLMEARLYIPLESGITSMSIGEDSFNIIGDKDFRNGFYEYYCRGISCAKQTITFKVNTSSKRKILVVKVISGLPDGLTDRAKNRGLNAVPRQAGDQTFVISEIEI